MPPDNQRDYEVGYRKPPVRPLATPAMPPAKLGSEKASRVISR